MLQSVFTTFCDTGEGDNSQPEGAGAGVDSNDHVTDDVDHDILQFAVGSA